MSDGDDSEDDGWAALEAKTSKGKKVGSDKAKKVATSKKEKSVKKGKKDEVEENGVEPSLGSASNQRKRTQTMPKSTAEETISLVVSDDVLVQADDSADDSAEEEIDDQTATLLKGFESSGDEGDEAEGPTPKQMAGAKIPNEKETRKKIGALAARDKVSTLRRIVLFPAQCLFPACVGNNETNRPKTNTWLQTMVLSTLLITSLRFPIFTSSLVITD